MLAARALVTGHSQAQSQRHGTSTWGTHPLIALFIDVGVAHSSSASARAMTTDDWRCFCRDTKRSLTPGGRPARKPRRIVMRLNELSFFECARLPVMNELHPRSQHRNASEFYVMERPTMSAGIGKWLCCNLLSFFTSTSGLERCMQSRPPLKIEALSHPSPCTYTLPWSCLTTRGVVRHPLNPRYSRGTQQEYNTLEYNTCIHADALPYRAKDVWTHSFEDDRQVSIIKIRHVVHYFSFSFHHHVHTLYHIQLALHLHTNQLHPRTQSVHAASPRWAVEMQLVNQHQTATQERRPLLVHCHEHQHTP